MIKVFLKIGRLFDFALACLVFSGFLILLSVRRLFGKIQIKEPKNIIVSLSKDGIFCIKRSNSPGYFDWDFKRPHVDMTYIYYIGDEELFNGELGEKVWGVNEHMPFENIKRIIPFTARAIQQIYGFWASARFILRIAPKVIEVMAPSKLTLRATLLKYILPVKLVTQVRGNQDLIYYFTPYSIYWPFQIKNPPFEIFQVVWDKFVTTLFYRSCDLVIGYNINNMLSAISNGAHPAKTKLSRIKVELGMLDVSFRERKDIVDLPQNGKIISVWSRLSPEKQVFESIQAFERLVDQTGEDLHFLIAGDGPERLRIEKYLETSKHKARIRLYGQKDRNFIAEMAHHSSLVVVPYGGSSLVEAVLLERPVVAFDIEWHNELIRDGETGWLADFPDPDHCAERMHDALSAPDECRKRAAAAKRLALSMFDQETIDAKEARYLARLFH